MPFLALVVPFLKTWWKVIVPVVLLLLALGYVKVLHLQIDHYKEQVVELRLQKEQANAKAKKLEDNATVISRKYELSLAATTNKIEADAFTKIERIKSNEAAKRIALTRELVELFNSTKPPSQPQTVTPTKPSNDETATPNRTTTLTELLVVSAKNDTNHQVCIETVSEWQQFWKDYVVTYGAVANEP